MTRLHVLAVILTLLIAGLLPSMALAQTSTFKVFYWPSSATASTSSQFGNWSTGFWGIDFRFEAPSPWGFHFNYGSGSQTSGGGSWSSLTSGTDTIWSADVSYRYQAQMATIHGFAGYGSLRWNSTFPGSLQDDTSTGFRLGADVAVPLGPGSNWVVNGSAAWYPSNTATLTFTPGGSSSASNTANDYSISLQYNAPMKWVVEGGWRSASFVQSVGGVCAGATPCTFQWTGFFVAVGRTFP